MEILGAIFLGLLVLVYAFEFATDLANDKKRLISSIACLAISAFLIYFLDIQSIDNEFSALLVAIFLVSGIYFFYSITTWLRKRWE